MTFAFSLNYGLWNGFHISLSDYQRKTTNAYEIFITENYRLPRGSLRNSTLALKNRQSAYHEFGHEINT